MKNTSGIFTTLALAGILLIACRPEKDKTPPSITSFTSPAEHDTLFSGNVLKIKAIISDDEALSQLKIDIHGAGDNHSHSKLAAASMWETIRIVDLSGTTTQVDVSVDIPPDAAAGDYHVILTAVDQSGNQSEFAEREIFIRNKTDLEAPEIQLFSPVEAEELALGTPLLIRALLTDSLGLGKLEMQVIQGSQVIFDKDLVISGVSYDLNDTLSTTGWLPGDYILKIGVFDQVLNQAQLQRGFVLKP